MSPLRRVVSVLVPFVALWVSADARGQEAAPAEPDGQEAIDDPKVSRRLGTRIDVPPPPAADAVAVPGPASAVEPLSATDTSVGPPAVSEEAAPAVPPPSETRTPRLKLGYRRFTFAQIGAAGTSGAGADEPFDVVSVDLYPISSTWRFGLTGQYGWQEGTFRQNGDAFFAAGLSLGWQIPGPVLTPFFETYAAGGLLQRTKSGLGLNSIATAYGAYGADLGTELFLAPRLFMSFAIGYVHLVDGFARKTFDTFSVDTWSFKLGFGL
jgi:hypothetical protein